MSSSSESSPLVINGNEVSKVVRQRLAAEVKELVDAKHPAPGLAVILVGTRKDSQTYVNMKTKSCIEIGMTPIQHDLLESTTTEEIVKLVKQLNADASINGILVQLPLPSHCDSDAVIAAIDPSKDVDGLTEENAGGVLRYGMGARLIPCTPLGCIALLDHYNISVAGKFVAVLGRSNLVGKPVAQLLLSRNATVVMCHSHTKNLAEVLQQADVVVAAIGKAEFVKSAWLKPGCVVIDVGINAVDDSTKKSGYRLVGDVDYAQAKTVASAITPVPGGVGPMTVAMLLSNTVKAYKAQQKLEASKQ